MQCSAAVHSACRVHEINLLMCRMRYFDFGDTNEIPLVWFCLRIWQHSEALRVRSGPRPRGSQGASRCLRSSVPFNFDPMAWNAAVGTNLSTFLPVAWTGLPWRLGSQLATWSMSIHAAVQSLAVVWGEYAKAGGDAPEVEEERVPVALSAVADPVWDFYRMKFGFHVYL